MRMRLKKHLDERIAECKDILLVREGDEFYKLTESERENFRQNLSAVFGNDNPVVLEIGCGKGAWAIQSARQNPNKNYLGVEKLSNVIVVACEQALQHGVRNLKFLNCRAENLGYVLPPCSIDEIALNFSCPFPKKTYANRRLTSKNFLQLYKRILKPNAVIYQKTDDLNFFEWSMESYRENGYEVFDVCYDLPANAEGNVVTEYEAKFRAIGKPIYCLKAKLK
ncbi:MAG: tRNA (guanosine(46)-N7)-methyltransferase TrmB [Clostridiales bacterium]|nr:tRNA (guanosine(46)-N7)-methyltransferase TrmB [Clostridiales bacterium]